MTADSTAPPRWVWSSASPSAAISSMGSGRWLTGRRIVGGGALGRLPLQYLMAGRAAKTEERDFRVSTSATETRVLGNYIGGAWVPAATAERLRATKPPTRDAAPPRPPS